MTLIDLITGAKGFVGGELLNTLPGTSQGQFLSLRSYDRLSVSCCLDLHSIMG